MKTIFFAATALALSGAAIAQTTEDTTMTTTTQTTGTTMATTGGTVAPGNNAPERDARGIPVVSDPATPPAGVNGPVPTGGANVQIVPAPNQSAAFATQASTENYPACSRTVTDNCVQNYERGRRR